MNYPKLHSRLLGICLTSLMLIGLGLSGVAEGKGNLVPNGNFERVDVKGLPADWNLYKLADGAGLKIVKDPTRPGKRILHVWAKQNNARTAGIRTDFLPVSPKTRYRLSLAGKIKDVRSTSTSAPGRAIGHMILYDAEKIHLLGRAAMNLTGSRDWLDYSMELDAPDSAAYVMLKYQLLRTSGQMWLDGIRFEAIASVDGQTLLLSTTTKIDKAGPIIFPKPQYAKDGGETVKISKKCLVSCDKSLGAIPLEELEKFLRSVGVEPVRVGTKHEPDGATEIHLRTKVGRKLAAKLPAKYANAASQDEGYVLACSGKTNEITIYASKPAGAFYGVQTLKQLVTKSSDGAELSDTLIADWPMMKQRGMVQGSQWFKHWWLNRDKPGVETYLDRAARLKLNHIHIAGSGTKMGGAFSSQSREPLNDMTRRQLKATMDDANKRFLAVTLAFKPTVPSDYIRKKPQPRVPRFEFDYLNEDHFTKLFAKFDAVYDLGIRSFSLNMDDLRAYNQSKLHEPRHIKRFGNIGAAHAYLAKRCYDHLKAKDPSIRLYMVPTYYTDPLRGGEEFDKYLSELAYLPKDIEMITVMTGRAPCEHFKKLTGRYPFIWSNFLPKFRSSKSVLRPPFNDGGPDITEYTTGYVFLPNSPKQEDHKGLSWLTAADYLWNPPAYNATESFNRVVSKHLPAELLSVIREYSKFKKRMFLSMPTPNYPVLGETKAKRIAHCQNLITELDKLIKKLEALDPSKVRDMLISECKTFKVGWENILTVTTARPHPIYVPKYTPTAQADEKTLLANSAVVEKLVPRGAKDISVPPPVATRFYLSHDLKKLYVTAFCDEPKMAGLKAKITRRDHPVFEDDCVEMFFGTDLKEIFNYYQFSVNANGAIFDSSLSTGLIEFDDPSIRVPKQQWNAHGVKAVAVKGAEQWTVRFSVPLASIGTKDAKIGTRIRFELGRERYASGKREIFSYAYPRGFHTPERFETIELAGPKSN